MGRRWGKTTLGLHRLTRTALDGHPTGWFAPSYKYLAEAWRTFVRILKPILKAKNETERRLELITGGVIEFWSLEDTDAGRSRRYQRVAIDEAAKVRYLERAWNESIRPTLADLRGDADFYSTPKGRDFFWQCFTRGEDLNQPDWACWRQPTASNPHINPEEVEQLRKQLPERVYNQEILAQFLDDAGGVFRKVREAIDRHRTRNELLLREGITYSGGIDLARVEDFTVLTVIDSTGRQVFHERFNQISWQRQVASIIAADETLRATWYVDSTGVGDPIYEQLKRAGLDVHPFSFTSASKERLIDNLAMQLERGGLRLMDLPDQENELLAYTYELTPERRVKMGAPEGMHDDCVIALALAAWGAAGAGTYSAGAW